MNTRLSAHFSALSGLVKGPLGAFAAALKVFLTPIAQSLRTSSIALVPFLIVLAILILLNEFTANQILNAEIASQLVVIRRLLGELYPTLFMIFFAYQYAGHLEINKTTAVSLSLMSVIFYNALTYSTGWEGFSKAGFIQTILIPILNLNIIYAYRKFSVKVYQIKFKGTLPQEISNSFELIIPSIIAIVLSTLFFVQLEPFFQFFKDQSHNIFYSIGNDAFLFVRMIVVHAIWAIGLHGDNIFNLFVNADMIQTILATKHLNESGGTEHQQLINKVFYDLFVVIGGSGSALALSIALMLVSVDKHSRKIGFVSFPFVIFNISEILIYGLPIIFNRIMLIPFFLVPAVNFLLAYAVYSTGVLQFSHLSPSWTTPIFINSYLAGNGSWVGPILQFFQLLIGIGIYTVFVKKYTQTQSSSNSIKRLITSLNLSEEISKVGDDGFHKAQKKIIKAHTELNDVIAMLEKNKLEMFYQPKMSAGQRQIKHFEALLRVRLSPTEVKGPFFLSTLEDASFASVIDLWVCEAVQRDIDHWRSVNLHPVISINLHPDTVSNPVIVALVAQKMKGYPVDFEIIERGELTNTAVVQNIAYLRKQGFEVALDDFGSGYSGFGVINNVPLDTIKIDKGLLDATEHAAGREVFLASIQLCKRLNIQSVVEGVETEAQMQFAIESGIDYIQGYHTGRPMSSSDVIEVLRSKE